MRKEEVSTQSRMSFYSELSHLRRSAITKYSENQNLADIQDSHHIYVIGLSSSHRPQLIRTLYCAMHNKMAPIKYLEQTQARNVVELTPNRQYDIKGSNDKILQVRAATMLVEPQSAIEPRNLRFYEQMLEQKSYFPFCSQRETKGDSVVLTLGLGNSIKPSQRSMLRHLIQRYRDQKKSVFIILTHFDCFNEQIRTLRDAEGLERSIVSVEKDLGVEREKIFLMQCYDDRDFRLNDEVNFYALQIMDEVMKACWQKEIEKPKGWLCGLFGWME